MNFAPIARLEGVRTLLAYATHRGFKVYQMDVKSSFLKGILDEEVYIEEPKVEPQEDNNTSHSKGKEPVLAKYVRRHPTPDQIIGDKSEGTMTRRKLKGTCLLADFEPRCIKDALENES